MKQMVKRVRRIILFNVVHYGGKLSFDETIW